MRIGKYDIAAYGMFIAYAVSSVIIPMALCHISVSLGFPLAEGGLAAGGALQIGRAVPMVVSMVLCGFLAARHGMRKTQRGAICLLCLGMIFAALASHYAMLFLALAIAGFGEGIIEGLGTPFVQQLHDDEPSRYINLAHSFWSIGVLLATLAGGYFLGRGISWRILVGGAALVGLAAFLLMGRSRRTPYPEREEAYSANTVLRQSSDILKTGRFWLFFAAMIFAGGGEFGLTFWTASYVQIVYSGTPWFAGVCTACFALGMFLGRSGFGLLVRQRNLYHGIMLAALGGIIVSLLLPCLGTSWLHEIAEKWHVLAFINGKTVVCILLFLAGIATAPFWPSIQSYTVLRLPWLNSTMIFIILSCAGVPGCALLTWLMGIIGNHLGLRTALIAVPLCYLLMALLLVFDRRLVEHRG